MSDGNKIIYLSNQALTSSIRGGQQVTFGIVRVQDVLGHDVEYVLGVGRQTLQDMDE